MELERQVRELAEIFQRVSLIACLAALAAIALGYVLYALGDCLARLRKLFGSSKVQGVVATIAIVGAVMYGGSKSTFRWDDGLRDAGSYTTNDLVVVRWQYVGIPSSSSVFIDYRESGTTNEWQNLAETVAFALEWTGTLANATNYDFWVYSTYVPPTPVHTNGVWVGQTYETKSRVGAKAFLILNGKIIEHGRTIAPPAAKRKDDEQ